MQKFRHSLICFLVTISYLSHAQTSLLNNNKSLEFLGLLNNKVILSSLLDQSLWVSDGTPAGTVQITNTVTYEDGGFSVLNNVLYFSGKSSATGTELWRTDGTAGGTFMVRDINPGPESSNPGDRFVLLNNEIYFSAFSATHGREVWKTNGSTNGTVLVKDVTTGTGSSNYSSLYKMVATNNFIYFVTNSSGAAGQLWRTDGTSDGTIMLRDCNQDGNFATPMALTTFNNKFLFTTETAATGRELWVTDGSVSGTVLVKDINPGNPGSLPNEGIIFNNKIYFTAETQNEGRELWVTDGTSAGTQLIKDIEPGNIPSDPVLYNAIKSATKFYFSCYSAANGVEIWESDGTTNGTKLFVDIEAGPGDAFPFLLTPFVNGYGNFDAPLFKGNKFFFAAFTVTHGYELYVTDGTVAGTKLVKDIVPGLGDGISELAWFYTKDYLYFSGTDNVFATELWRTDGTTNNTLIVNDIAPFAASSNPSPMVIVNNKLLFTANNGDAGATDLFAVISFEQVLPVKLLSFTGKQMVSGNLLEWKTANEDNFEGYIVERSIDGRNFTAIAQVNATASNTYQFEDKQANTLGNICYYRLQLKDKDGQKAYSAIISINKTASSGTVKVYPNQQKGLTIKYQLPESKSDYRIIDVQGKILATGNLAGSAGVAQISLPHQSSGIVLVQIQSGNFKTTERVILP